MIKFKATTEQLQALYALLYNASAPMGLGHLHYNPDTMLPEQVTVEVEKGFYMDYVKGRMVKFMCRGTQEPGTYTTNSDRPRADYQSWCYEYPTVQDALKAAGITDIQVEEPTK